jgi:MtaA/CmuA family methyltransferase
VAPSVGTRNRDSSQGIMSGRRRYLSALFGGRVDRVPAGSPTSVATLELMRMAESYFPEAHLDGEKMARLAATAHEVLGYDAIMPVFCAHIESAALGLEIDWGVASSWPVSHSHPFDEPEMIQVPSDFLEKPSMRAALDAISSLRRQYGDRVAIIGKVYGPWSLSYHLHGTENFLLETLLDPDKVRRYLDALLPASLLSGKAQIEAGADAILWGDHATGDLVKGTMYRDFLLPVHRHVTQTLGAPIILHICGNTADRLEYIVQAGFDGFHFDSKVDAREAKRVVGNRMSLVGNVNNSTTLMAGTPEDVRRETLYALAAGVEIAAPECAIPLVTPIENLRAIAEAAREFRPEDTTDC